MKTLKNTIVESFVNEGKVNKIHSRNAGLYYDVAKKLFNNKIYHYQIDSILSNSKELNGGGMYTDTVTTDILQAFRSSGLLKD